ncbi:MAG: ABC transporter ATP-binding protein [Thermoflexaceae bacterium]|nr:ABC transporter ATP-binding protein [Thermoflexaceae bacterium]
MSYIVCKDVTLGYEGKTISHNINFTVNPGDYLCIVGENGVGKSTLIKTLLNLKKPLSGEIIRGDGIKEYEIGYLPQQTVVQKDFPASVREVVLSGCLNRCGLRPFYSKAEKQICEENMERMGIAELKNTCYRELSGGQQQRVLLARALCAARKILLLDEPVAGLDPRVTMEMYELIKDLNKEGITIIMVSHDIDAAVKYATHILHMDNKPAFFGVTADYLGSSIYQSFMKKGGKEDE